MNLFRAENMSRRMEKEGASKAEMVEVFQKAYSWEHKQLNLRHRLHNHSHGIKRSQVMALIIGEKVCVDQIAKQLPLPNPVSARSAALFHLNCLMNEGVLTRDFDDKMTWYVVKATEEE